MADQYLSPTPYANPLTGYSNDLIQGLLGYMKDKQRTQQMQGLAGLLESTGIPQSVERAAYAQTPKALLDALTNVNRANVPLLKAETADALMTLAPVGGASARLAKRGAMAAGRAGERLAERVVPQVMERGGLPAQLLGDLSQGSMSQVIQKNPAPFIVKHGTNQPFEEFKSGMGVTAKHIYTTPEEYAQDAAKYGDTLITAQASPKSLIDFSSEGKLDKQTISALKKAAKDAGITDKYYPFESFIDDVMSGQLYQKGGGSRDQDALLSELFSKYEAVKMPDATSGGGLSKSVVFENPSLLKVLQDEGLLGQSKAASAFDVSRRDASDIFGAGAERVMYKDPKSGGTMEVLAKPDGTASVLSLEVPETSRGKGIGQSLQAQVMQDFPEMMGQVSSKAAAKTAYRLGRRPPYMPDATLDDVYKMLEEDSSVNLVSPQMQKRFMPETTQEFTYPQEEAMMMAQQRAALPPEQGGLGLPAGNTADQRAAAQYGKDMVHFSRAGGDYTTLDSGKFAIAPFDAVGTHVGTPQAAMERFQNTVGYKVNNPNYANDELTGATYPVTILGNKPLMNQNGMPFGEDDLNAFLRQQGGHNYSDIHGGKMTYQDMNADLRKKLFDEQGYTSIPYFNEVEGKGSISYIVPPENLRSRFAAFDPFRRSAAIAALMGVAAPDLLAEEAEKPKKKKNLLD